MKNKWERNKMWYLEMWLILAVVLLTISILVGFAGWMRYRDTLKLKLESEQVIGRFFESIQ